MGIYRIVCLLLLLPVLLGGCGASSSLVRYDISGDVESLDPQFADEENEQLVIYNIMEGLMCQLPSGELTNGVIEGYDVSADQLTYTFHLRDGMVWDDADSTPVTAHDFVFAFQRIFNSIYPSPFASLYSAIRNSQQVLSGELQTSELGVQATDDLTVVFTLNYADPSFLESLAHSSAMPCSQKLFEAAGGRYGTSISQTFSNGPFTLMQWENGNRIYLKKNSSYYDAQAVQTPGLYLYMDRDVQTSAQAERGEEAPTFFSLLMEGRSDGCLADYSQYLQAQQAGLSCEETQGTVWALVFNQTHSAFSNQQVRQGFIRAIDRSTLEDFLRANQQDNLHTYDRLIPPAITLFTQSYTEQTTVNTVNTYDPQAAYEAYRSGHGRAGGRHASQHPAAGALGQPDSRDVRPAAAGLAADAGSFGQYCGGFPRRAFLPTESWGLSGGSGAAAGLRQHSGRHPQPLPLHLQLQLHLLPERKLRQHPVRPGKFPRQPADFKPVRRG